MSMASNQTDVVRGIIMGFVKQTKMVVAMSGSAECSFAVYSSQLLKSIEQKFKETLNLKGWCMSASFFDPQSIVHVPEVSL